MAPDFFSSFFYRAWDLLCPQSSKEQTVYTLVDLCEYCLDLITFFASSGEIKKHLLKRPTHPTCQFCQGLLQPMFEDVKDSDNQFFNLSFRRDKDFGRPPNYEWLWCYGYCRCEDTNDSVASLYFAIWSNDGESFQPMILEGMTAKILSRRPSMPNFGDPSTGCGSEHR